MYISVPNLVYTKHLYMVITKDNDVVFIFEFQEHKPPRSIRMSYEEAIETHKVLGEFLEHIKKEK